MKRYSLLTLLLLTLTLSASAFVVDEFEFTIIDAETNSVSVKRNKAYDYSSIESLTIPATIAYADQTYNVTEIAFEGFRDIRAEKGFPLKKINLPEGLKVIGGKAFVGLYDIQGTTVIPSTVDTIGDYAFADWVTPIQFLSEVPAALGGTQVFRDALKQNSSIIIPCRTYDAYSKVRNWNIWISRIVDPCLFSDGTYTYQVLPEDDSKVAVKALVDNSIQHVTFSTEVTNPDNDQTYLVVKIADNCFKDNAIIKSVALPTSIVAIGEFAFYNCKNLQTISLNEGLEIIGQKAFAHDSLVIGTLTIPASVTYIGTSAFYNFCKIEKIEVLPETPPTIEASIFTALSPKVSIWIPCNTYDYYVKAWKAYASIIVDPCIFSDGTYTYQVSTEDDSKVTVKALVDNSVQNVTFSTEVTNPYNKQTYVVSTIADNCFKNNSTITSVVLPNSIVSIGDFAFYNCKKLQSISLNEGLKTIGVKSFAHDSLITGTLTIPSSVSFIDTSAFYNLLKIKKIEVLAETPPTIGASVFFALPNDVLIWIPCNTYQNYAKKWSGYKTLLVDPCVALIENIYYSMTDSGVVVIGYDTLPKALVFKEEVTINEQTKKVISIASKAFYNVQTLTSVTVPSTIKYIGDNAFRNCKNLSTLNLNEGLLSVGDTCFINCVFPTLKTPSSLRNIGKYAFRTNPAMTTLVLNEGLEIIGERAFTDNTALKDSLIIPSTVKEFGAATFTKCNLISCVIFKGITPPNVVNDGNLIFSNPEVRYIIPCGAMGTYKNATYWKDLSSKFVSACKPLTLKKGEELTQEDTIVSSIAYRRTFDMDVWQTLYLPFEVDSVLVYDEQDAKYYDINYPFVPEYGGYFYLNEYDTTNVEEATITFTTATMIEKNTAYLIQFPTTDDGYFEGKDIVFKSKAGEYTLNKSDYPRPEATTQFQVLGNSSVYNQSVSDMYIFRATPVMGKDGTPLQTVDGKDSIKYEFNQQASATLNPFEFGLLPYVVEPSSGISSAPMRMSLRIGRSSGNTGGGDITTSVSETHAPNAITYRTGVGELALSLNGLPCELYSVSGTLLFSSAGGTEEITIPLEKGIYILYSEGKSQKIVL